MSAVYQTQIGKSLAKIKKCLKTGLVVAVGMNLASLAITLVSSSNWLASLVVSLAKYAMCAMLKLQLQFEFAFNSPAVDYKYASVSNSGVLQ